METTKYEIRPFEWFSERGGKLVYREGNATPIKIKDLAYAGYLCDAAVDFNYKYSD